MGHVLLRVFRFFSVNITSEMLHTYISLICHRVYRIFVTDSVVKTNASLSLSLSLSVSSLSSRGGWKSLEYGMQSLQRLL